MTTNVKIRVIETNEDCKIFAVKARITEEYYSWDATHANYHDEKLTGVVSLISEIDGVSSILVHAYDLWISKGSAYDWSEIEPQIISILDQFVVSMRM